jgi:hypothetical protein
LESHTLGPACRRSVHRRGPAEHPGEPVTTTRTSFNLFNNYMFFLSLAPMKVRGLTKRLKSNLEHGRVSIFLVFTR